MTKDIFALPPETFFRLAVERGGLDLDEATKGLTPEVAEALRHISTSPISTAAVPPLEPTRGATRSSTLDILPDQQTDLQPQPRASNRPSRNPVPRKCSACGRINLPRDHFCRDCGRSLDDPPPFLTLDDLVEQGRLTAKQAEEAKNAILSYQRHYPAGTRYSIFGGPS